MTNIVHPDETAPKTAHKTAQIETGYRVFAPSDGQLTFSEPNYVMYLDHLQKKTIYLISFAFVLVFSS